MVSDGPLAEKIIHGYRLSETALTGASLTDQTVAGLSAAQTTAYSDVRFDLVVQGATNKDIEIVNGTYTLLDTVANLLGDPEGLVGSALSYAIEDSGAAFGDIPTPEQQLLLEGASSVTAISGEGEDFVDLSHYSGVDPVDFTIIGNANGNIIYAGDGNDVIYGGGGNDDLDGGGGADELIGGGGNDLLYGRAGIDTFRFSTTQLLNGSDTVADFDTVSDKIAFDFGKNGELTQDSLRGTEFESVEYLGTVVNSNAGMIVISTTLSGVALSGGNASNIAEQLSGLTDGDQFYLAYSNGQDTGIFRIADTVPNTSFYADTAELIVTLNEVTSLSAADFVNFSADDLVNNGTIA